MNPRAHAGPALAASDSDSDSSQRAASRARIAEIESHMLELEHSLGLLQEKELLQARLDAYTYPVLTLPNEIVSEIFVHFLPVYPSRPPLIGRRSPSHLGQICRKWREIALGTPALWRAVRLCLHKRRCLGQHLQLLETFLQRSGSYRLSIELLNKNTTDWDAAKMDPFLHAIIPHSARWEHLNLDMPNYLLPSITGPFPSLRSLRIVDTGLGLQDDDEPLALTFHTAPFLGRVHLRVYYDFYYAMFPWSQLSVLTLEWILERQFAEILSRAGQPRFLPVRVNIITLPCLETFIISEVHGSPGVGRRYLDRLTLPALRRLQVTERLLKPDPIATVVSLVLRWGCNLEELRVDHSTSPGAWYQDALPSVDSFIFDGHINLEGMLLEDWANEDEDNGRESESGRRRIDQGRRDRW
ncbi:hypothetical protein FB451DRAFT_1301949 [Mycena latifolia]|nr:hypothetical protein FB451DRAFT_1301949 [Mycena latifolia]